MPKHGLPDPDAQALSRGLGRRAWLAGGLGACLGWPAAGHAQAAVIGRGPRPESLPTTPGQRLVVLALDLRNGGILAVAQGLKEAASAAGWSIRLHDAGGLPAGQSRALREARLDGADAVAVLGPWDEGPLEASLGVSTPMAGWHHHDTPGVSARSVVRTDVTTDPALVAGLAAGVVTGEAAHGAAGVVIYTDPTAPIARRKSDLMARAIEASAHCRLLEVVDLPLAQTPQLAVPRLRELRDRHGAAWTHALAINDLYFDHMVPALATAADARHALRLISAGDGSPSAFMRIRAGLFQTATVAEPLRLQAWLLLDELNRMRHGRPPAGLVPEPGLISAAWLQAQPPGTLRYDPAAGYREALRLAWRTP